MEAVSQAPAGGRDDPSGGELRAHFRTRWRHRRARNRLDARVPARSRAGTRAPWLGLVIFYTLLAVLYANVIYVSMLDHDHSWWRLVLWQLANWLAWAGLTPAVLALSRKVPIEPRWRRWGAVAFHGVAGVAVSLVHLVPLALATVHLQPYDSMTPDLPFAETYRASLGSWFRLDVAIYWAILAAATAWEAFRRSRERERRATELEGMLARARLDLLRLQLEPHFLFNTLHTATGLVREGRGDVAVIILVRLGDLLREVLQRSGEQTVSLAEELALLDGYLEIQQARFPDLRVERRFDPASLRVHVPSFILQPLLENAVEHGVAGAGDERWVRLASRLDGGRLEVTVENAADSDRTGRDGAGLGLTNCRRRLEALYGAAGGIRLEHLDSGTVRATLRLPAHDPSRPDAAAGPAEGGREGAESGEAPRSGARTTRPAALEPPPR